MASYGVSTPLAAQPLTAFTLFPKLPPEIRVMIWKLQLPGPRIVHLSMKQTFIPRELWLSEVEARQSSSEADDHPPIPSYESHREHKEKFPFVCLCATWCKQKAPTILFVNRESRALGMTVYTATLGTIGRKKRTWFSPKHDNLYMDSETIDHILSLGLKKGDIGVDFSKVRKLLVAQRPREWSDRAKYKRLWAVLQWFAKLEHATIVTEYITLDGTNQELALGDGNAFFFKTALHVLESGYSISKDVALKKFARQFTREKRQRLASDIAGINQQRQEDIEEVKFHSKGDFPELPVITSFKLVWTAAQDANFMEATSEYVRQKVLFRKHMYVSPWGGEYRHFSASFRSTVEDAIESFRAVSRYSKDTVLHLRFRGATLPPQMKIFDIPGFSTLEEPCHLEVVPENKKKRKSV